MQLCRMSLAQDNERVYNLSAGTVIAIGNFDGIHLGHQRVLAEVKKWKEIHKASTLVFSFHPAPKTYFTKDKIKNVMGFRDKFTTLKALGLDYLCLYRFDKDFANLRAEDFVKEVLLKKLHAKHVVVGEDFRFGKARVGDVNTLRQLGKQYGFDVSIVPILTIDGEKVSSTRIRDALLMNDVATAEKLLGYTRSKLIKDEVK